MGIFPTPNPILYQSNTRGYRAASLLLSSTSEEVRRVLLDLVDGAVIQMGSKYKELVK